MNYKLGRHLIIHLKLLYSVGDWGLGIGDWAQSPESPIPNPQSPIPNHHASSVNNYDIIDYFNN